MQKRRQQTLCSKKEPLLNFIRSIEGAMDKTLVRTEVEKSFLVSGYLPISLKLELPHPFTKNRQKCVFLVALDEIRSTV